MKISFILLFMVLNFPGTFSQILNGSFENWNGTEPEGWKTSNSPNYIYVIKSTDSHSGNYALSSSVIDLFGMSYGGYLRAGEDGKGFLISEKYTNLSGYYKFLPADTSDRISIIILISHISDTDTSNIGYGIASLAESKNFSQFNIGLEYSDQSLSPNLIKISISFINFTSLTGHLGSTYYLDDLSLNNAVNVEESFQPKFDYVLYQNYPNPFNPSTSINYEIKENTFVTLKVFDAVGREVQTLVHEMKTPGRYAAKFDGKNITSGIYFYQLRAGTYVETKKMMMLR